MKHKALGKKLVNLKSKKESKDTYAVDDTEVLSILMLQFYTYLFLFIIKVRKFTNLHMFFKDCY